MFKTMKEQEEPFVSFDGIEVDLEKLEDGSVDLDTYKTARANGRGFEILYTKLDNEALIYAAKNCVSFCNYYSRGTYESTLHNILVP